MGHFSIVRSACVVGTIVMLFIALAGRVLFLQSFGRESTVASADRQQHQTIELQARRGPIFDRNGVLMAGTTESRGLFVDPQFMQEQYQTAGHDLSEMDDALGKLGTIIDKDPFELAKLLGDRASSRFIKIADNLDDTALAKIQALNIPGLGFTNKYIRSYPMGSLAAHVLGGCGSDGAGLDGLELKYNQVLAGKAGYASETKDARRRPIGVSDENYLPPEHGQHLVLTIDSNMQMIVEQELADSVEHFKAKRGEMIVMDPKTGDVLALANYPTFDPETLDDSSAAERTNSALVAPYEPGSAFKPFIASKAFMWNVTNPGEVWHIPGITWLTPYGRKITDDYYYGNLCSWDGLVKSSNIVMSQLSERLGNAKIYQAITSFGFGQKTGIDLPGESGGKVNPLSKWSHLSTDSVAQGYEVMVTPVQLARAFSAIANGGRLVTPHIVLGTVDPVGNVMSRQNTVDFDSLPQVIDSQTAALMRRILSDVVIRGTAKGNRSKVWNISGKTGTAHISEGKSGYSQTKFNSTFMCMAPVENPRFVVVCTIHESDKSLGHFGADVAAPAATQFLERALTYLDVPSSPDLPLPPPEIAAKLNQYTDKQITNRNFGAMTEPN